MKKNEIKTNDSVRTTNPLEPAPRPATDKCQANRHSKEKTIGAEQVGFKTWIAKWRDGQGWQFIKAPRCPKINAKFLSRGAALRAAEAQLQNVNKNKLRALSQTR